MNNRIFLFGNDVDTDIIAPGGYLHLGIETLKKHSMEALDVTFPSKVKAGDVLIAGRNFGTGSSREQAPLVLKELGIDLVLSVSFARIFYRNAINVGLNIGVISSEEYSRIKDYGSYNCVHDEKEHKVMIIGTREEIKYSAPGGPVSEIIRSGGLVNYVMKKLENSHKEKL